MSEKRPRKGYSHVVIYGKIASQRKTGCLP
jgi:hypothetical protein